MLWWDKQKPNLVALNMKLENQFELRISINFDVMMTLFITSKSEKLHKLHVYYEASLRSHPLCLGSPQPFLELCTRPLPVGLHDQIRKWSKPDIKCQTWLQASVCSSWFDDLHQVCRLEERENLLEIVGNIHLMNLQIVWRQTFLF